MVIAIIALLAGLLCLAQLAGAETRRLSRADLLDKIRGGWTGHPKYNFHANGIDFQIESDFIGLMCPGLPRVSNQYCDRVGRVMNYGDGLYGGMFVCGMDAAAYFETDPRRIVEAGLAGLPALADKKFNFTDYSFNDIVKSTEARALKVIQMAGGKVTDTEVVIPVQQPQAPELEQWTPGIADRRLPATDAAFTWKGTWAAEKKFKTSGEAGNEVTLTFTGCAVAILGMLAQDGGQADVYLDGKKTGVADAYIVERTNDSVLWNAYGLKPGAHTVRLVTTDAADARSKGKRLTIQAAVTYR